MSRPATDPVAAASDFSADDGSADFALSTGAAELSGDSNAPVNGATAPSTPPSASVVVGTILGLTAAVLYTSSNCCLRQLGHCDTIWVTTMKEVPIVLLMTPWVFVRLMQGTGIAPNKRALSVLLVVAIVNQFVGNCCAIWAIGLIGIALSVPLILGAIILGGSTLGKLFLGEPFTYRTGAAIAVLIVAISLLCFAAQSSGDQVLEATRGPREGGYGWLLWMGVAAAVAAGSSYACLGVTLRYCLRSGNPVSTSMVVVGLTGVVFLGGLAYARLGPAMFTDTTLRDFLLMSGSGWFNALAFLALTSALTRLHVGQVNMLNSTQTAMAAIVGVAAFNEPLTALLVAGIGLTIIGLFIKDPPTNADARDHAVPAGEEML